MTVPTNTWNDNSRDPAVSTALILAFVMLSTVGLALGFEHIGGYIPCKLCLEQRWPYYIGGPLMLLTAYAGASGVSRGLLRLLLAIGVIILAISLFLGIKHTGVEYGWWAGPTDCGVGGTVTDTGGKGVLDALNTYIPPSCDKAAWRDPILRLSFAGWNVVISFLLLLVALRGLRKT